MYRCWDLLKRLHKPKHLIAINVFVHVFRQKSSSLYIHELTAANTYTVFPRNLAVAKFNFKALYHAVTIRGQLDFEGGVYRD